MKSRVCLSPITLQPLRKFFRWKHLSKSALAGLLIALLATASLSSASSAFHKWLHHDATQQDHQCAITLLEQHQVLSSDVCSTLLISDWGLVLTALPAQTIALPSVDYSSSPSRAPPASSLL
ncbi:MAG: hypothetical protein ABIP71_05935 [Verrucomicrobiota bacterium]